MPIGDLLAQISGGPNPTMTMPTATLPPKRKANDDLRKPVDKLQKPNTVPTSRPITQTQRPTAVDTSMGRMRIDTNTRKPAPRSANTANTTFKNGQPTPPPSSTESSKPPKKGSFQEILARGKAAQASMGQVGVIRHKSIEKAPPKREMDKARTQKGKTIQKGLEPDSKFQKSSQVSGRNVQSGLNGMKSAKAPPPAVEKKVKKAATATTGYTGTARPRPGGGVTTSKPAASSYSSRSGGNDRYKNGRKNLDRYYATDEDEDDMEEDIEEDDYASDVSSDMEAATFEVDEEEEMAAAIARKEDAEALAEENRLKKEKAEKRARLAAMAKSRR
ncbi:0df7bade-4226-4fee-acf3-99cf6648794b [Sclerotinia trifoliorum]|uniref:0df7bade-4226-4fee-acf3-99cf6648794b n=1 Tax=Sclerotinia trifoliorum TaxID=28548 RepID=A0A8H2ZLL9_9HELO|nr:0df7bade-4226-4fee-acf3-99cf6648794b [Sclerotinia trifoliorum]